MWASNRINYRVDYLKAKGKSLLSRLAYFLDDIFSSGTPIQALFWYVILFPFRVRSKTAEELIKSGWVKRSGRKGDILQSKMDSRGNRDYFDLDQQYAFFTKMETAYIFSRERFLRGHSWTRSMLTIKRIKKIAGSCNCPWNKHPVFCRCK